MTSTISPHTLVMMNTVIALAGLWLGLWMYSRYHRVLYFKEYRFRLFALRDRLTVLVMNGSIREGSVEHETFLRILDGSIQATERFRVSEFLRFLVTMSRDRDLADHLKRIRDRLGNVHNKEYAAILVDFYSIVGTKVNRDLNLLRRIVRIIAFQQIQKKQDTVKQANAYVQENKKTFSDLAGTTYA